MKQIKYIALVLLVATGAAGCSDFLQKDPPGSLSQITFWTKKADFDYALAAVYKAVQDDNSGQRIRGTFSVQLPFFDALTDNSFTDNNENTFGMSLRMQQGDITSDMDGFPNHMYIACYRTLSRIHQIIFQLENFKGELSDDDKDFYLGQCLGFRAYLYHWMYMSYREFPLITELLTLENQYQPKAARADIRTQMMKDFDDAIALLPDENYYEGRSQGFLTPDALKVFKSRILMYEAYGDTGVADVTKMAAIIPILESIEGYELTPNLREVFVEDFQASNKEIIFSSRYAMPDRTNSTDLYFGQWQKMVVTRDFVDAFECTDGLPWGESPLTVAVDESLINTTDGSKREAQLAERSKLFVNRDKRMEMTVTHSGTVWYPQDPGYEGVKWQFADSHTGFTMQKLVQPHANVAPGNDSRSGPDVVIARWAHVLLMIAEAENEVNGPTEKAYKAVNDIRVRSGQPVLPEGLTKEQMRERIRQEWRIETCFESGLRYYHMKQWRVMNTLNSLTDPKYVSAIVKWEDRFYFWPLPFRDVDQSKGILVQDPNYN